MWGEKVRPKTQPLSKILALFVVGAYKHTIELAREPSAKGHPPTTFLCPYTPPSKLTQIKLNTAILKMDWLFLPSLFTAMHTQNYFLCFPYVTLPYSRLTNPATFSQNHTWMILVSLTSNLPIWHWKTDFPKTWVPSYFFPVQDLATLFFTFTQSTWVIKDLPTYVRYTLLIFFLNLI